MISKDISTKTENFILIILILDLHLEKKFFLKMN